MPSRRFHQKTRHGCSKCKQRKIRCDQVRPICQNCTRLGGRCTFMDLASTHTAAAKPSEPRAALEALGFASPQVSSFTSKDIHVYDTALVANYSKSTCCTMTDNPSVFPLWQVTIPHLALAHPFLRHGLLAISAMHLYSTSPPSTLRLGYVNLARQHQGRALATYIPTLGSIDQSNHTALFAFSAIITSLAYAFLLQADDDDIETTPTTTAPAVNATAFIARLTNVFTYMVGTTEVAAASKTWIRDDVLAPMVTLRSLGSVLPGIEQGPQTALDGLLALVGNMELREGGRGGDGGGGAAEGLTQRGEGEARNAQVYRDAIEKLSNVYPAVADAATFPLSSSSSSSSSSSASSSSTSTSTTSSSSRRPDFGAAFGWPVFVDRRYIGLVKELDPFALLILAHYGAGLHAFEGFWQLRGLGRKIVGAVVKILGGGSDWEGHLQWARRRVGEEGVGEGEGAVGVSG